jgi:regulatory protein
MAIEERRPVPDWLGDVSAGVEAWTHSPRQARPTSAEPAGAGAPARSRPAGRGSSDDRRRRRSAPAAPADPVTEIPEADAEAVARKILLDQLTGQARSRRELADRLAKKLVPEAIATRLLDRFEEVGLIDDAAFARSWISSRGSDGRGLARRALAQELRRKGVADEVARDALDEIDGDDEREAARVLVRRKLRSMGALDDQVKVRRLVGMLGRKGYPPGLCFAVVRDEVGAEPLDDMSQSSL